MQTKKILYERENSSMRKLKINKTMLGIFTASIILSSTACNNNKKENCDIEFKHAHKYESVQGFTTYKISEKEEIDGLFRKKESKKVTKEIEKISKFGLLKISDNLDKIYESLKKDNPYVEYQYKYEIEVIVGVIPIPVKEFRYKYTTNQNHSNLTGVVRDVSYQYKAYKLSKNKNGKDILIESGLVNNLLEIKDEYPYFKLDDYKQKVYKKRIGHEKVLR